MRHLGGRCGWGWPQGSRRRRRKDARQEKRIMRKTIKFDLKKKSRRHVKNNVKLEKGWEGGRESCPPDDDAERRRLVDYSNKPDLCWLHTKQGPKC